MIFIGMVDKAKIYEKLAFCQMTRLFFSVLNLDVTEFLKKTFWFYKVNYQSDIHKINHFPTFKVMLLSFIIV